MSFQFPANPKDGDVVIRLVNGVQIKGTYNETTNTWEVGELPEEPGVPGPAGPKGEQGDKGDPGQGLSVSGIVETETSLPPANDHFLQFWLVDDTNTLYFSDGNEWSDLGSPIQGPPGDDGADGADGTNGLNGAPGKGWYDTNIIDQRPSNYQISFLSNDGLGFTTDNIMGPQGDPGELEVASETNLGGIKIGRGLSISPDGTLNAGVTNVDLETTPVAPGALQVPYAPIYNLVGEYKTDSWVGARNDYEWSTGSWVVEMPSRANKASVYVFASSTMQGSPDTAYSAGNTRSFRLYSTDTVTLGGAIWSTGQQTSMTLAKSHNLCYLIDSQSLAARKETKPLVKINEISFEPGASVTFNYVHKIVASGSNLYTAGGIQIMLIPFRDIDEDDETFYSAPQKRLNSGVYRPEEDVAFFNEDEIDPDDIFPVPTPEEQNAIYAEQFKSDIEDAIRVINAELDYVNETTQNELIGYRDQLRAARDLPGTAEDIANYLTPILNAVNAIVNYNFRFEV